jgi:uncharacterized protein
VPIWTVLLIGGIVLVGAFVQSTIGLGLGLLAAPPIALLEPSLVPTLLLLLAIPVSTALLWIERDRVDWWAIRWALPAKVPGTVVGVWLATAVSARALGVAVGVMVLVAVALTLRTVAVRRTRGTLVAAGLVSGISGTAVAVGGPPLAIVMSHRPSREVRATLSLLFVVGSLLSLASFALAGALPTASLVLGATYLPLLAVAFVLGTQAHLRISGQGFRLAVLGVCAASALALLVRSLV